MRKALLPVFILICCAALFGGCIRNTPYVTTTNPSMTASIHKNYRFVASSTVPYTLDSQAADTTKTLVITGYGSDRNWPNDKIVISVASYRGATGTFSIVQGQAAARYEHGGIVSPASGGVVSITSITSQSIIGYFSFTTVDNIPITEGEFNVNIP